MKNFYNGLSPNNKRFVVLGGIAAVAVAAAWFSMSNGEERTIKRTQKTEDVRAVLTSRNSRTVGMESLAAQQRNLEKRNADLERQLENLRRDSSRSVGLGEAVKQLTTQLEKVESSLDVVTKENERLSEQLSNARDFARDPGVTGEAHEAEEPEKAERQRRERPVRERPESRKEDTVEAIFSHTPDRPAGATEETQAAQTTGGTEPAARKVAIRTIRAEETPVDKTEEEEGDGLYLPVGSIITGVLINGMDAPTGKQARREPFPATLRIQKEAILPNHFTADVRECFMQVGGYGDLSSERAYLRGEAISCVRDDGGIIEARLDSYAVGEDGKAGVRGRLVSKEGQLLARSLMAGFLEGVSGAFNVQAAPSLRIDGGDTLPIYKQTMDADRVQGGFARGTGNALSRLADYYMDMADSIFPVIEIDAGRQIDIVIVRGTNLKIKSKGKS